MLNVVVGYDPREWEAYQVCVDSLRRTSSEAVNIVCLDDRELRQRGLYDRPYRVDEKGQFWDERDGRPFSTGFAFTRFLIPWLGLPKGPVLFVDCDFVFLGDVAELFALHDWNKAVRVVQHFHSPVSGVKMDAISQGTYPRKNWSSCMLWNTAHPGHERLTLRDVNMRGGRDLHRFCWLNEAEIGDLPESWNWLAGISPTTGTHDYTMNAIHYTEGGPWFAHMRDCALSAEWYAARAAMHGNVTQLPEVSLSRRKPGRPRKVDAG